MVEQLPLIPRVIALLLFALLATTNDSLAEPASDSPHTKHETVGEDPPPSVDGPFQMHNIHLHARIRPEDMPHVPASLTDIWGYVSPSGREYALVGTRTGTLFVDVTDPHNPDMIAVVAHGAACCSDIKTYLDYAYVVAENLSTGMQIIDLSDIDNGNVSLVNSFFGGGLNASHNIAINEDAGMAYVVGGVNTPSLGGIAAIDLANPEAPVFRGYWTSTYVHDLQVVTYYSGPYAGRSMAFAAGNPLTPGLHIIDVTNPAGMFLRRYVTYPNAGYAHQGWLSEDRRYFYLNDEFDESDSGVPTSTHVFDVQDPVNATYVTTFSTGLPSTDHNLMVKGKFIFEANYSSGLRIIHTPTPFQFFQVGWIDTYPNHDNPGFIGAWGVYPMLPSGTILVSDITNGLFILDANAAFAAVPELPATTPPTILILTLLLLLGGAFKLVWR